MVVVSAPTACTRCLICEMACSFHHIGEFSRCSSSIKIDTSLSEIERVPRITISFETGGTNPTCDLCEREEIPFCVRFCPEKVLKREAAPV